MFLSLEQAEQEILEAGRRIYARGFVAANDGNISCRVGEDRILTTPTGVSKGFMTKEMLVLTDMDGNIISGHSKPSSELKMHIRVYKENPKIGAVVHAHPPISTAFAVAGISLNSPIITESVLTVGVIPVAHYATPGSQGVPDSVAPYCKDYNGLLLANHGTLTWGNTPIDALYRMESVEQYAQITMYTGFILKQQRSLSESQIDELMSIRTRNGTMAGGRPVGVSVPCNLNDVV